MQRFSTSSCPCGFDASVWDVTAIGTFSWCASCAPAMTKARAFMSVLTDHDYIDDELDQVPEKTNRHRSSIGPVEATLGRLLDDRDLITSDEAVRQAARPLVGP